MNFILANYPDHPEKYKLLQLIPIPLLITMGFLLNVSFSFCAIAYITYLMIKNDNVHNYYIGLFLVPNIRIFDNIGVTYIVNILMALPLLVLLIKKKNTLDFRPFFWTFILFILELCHLIIFEYYEDLFATTSIFIGMLFCLLLSFEKNKMLNMYYAWIYFVLGILMSSIVYLGANYDYANYLILNIINGYRFSAFSSDPNYLSLYICLSLSFIFTFSKLKWYHYAITIILIILGFFTASKMCFVLMTSILLVGFAYNIVQFQNFSRLKYSSLSLLLLMLMGVIYFDKLILFLNNLIKRSGLGNGTIDANTLSTGRWNILVSYMDIISSNILSIFGGNGMKYYLVLNQGFVAHNTYFDILLSCGIVGTVVLLVILISWLGMLNFQKKIIFYFPLVVLSVNLLDLSCFSATMFWWIVSFCIYAAQSSPKIEINLHYINERNYIK